MLTQIVSSKEEFARLRESWETLATKDPKSTPFQSWEWNYSWWEHLRGEKELSMILVLDNAGTIEGIAPFWLRVYPEGIRVLELIGTRGTDYLNWLLPPGKANSITNEILEFLSRNPFWDLINLEDISEDSLLLTLLPEQAVERKYFVRRWRTSPCFSIPLPNKWPLYLSTLSRRTRRDILYDRRYLERRHSFQYVRSGADEIALHIGLHQKRQQSRSQRGSFAEPDVCRFLRSVTQRFEEKGWLRLTFLRVSDIAVASICAAEFHRKVFAMTVGFDPDFGRYSVGSVLYGFDIEDAISSGFVEYDLSRGAESYKLKWGGHYKENVGIVLCKNESMLLKYLNIRSEFVSDLGYAPSSK
jgi:CelD/BcsL family acetyltransferase involved in cellulose biosynthesis